MNKNSFRNKTRWNEYKVFGKQNGIIRLQKNKNVFFAYMIYQFIIQTSKLNLLKYIESEYN